MYVPFTHGFFVRTRAYSEVTCGRTNSSETDSREKNYEQKIKIIFFKYFENYNKLSQILILNIKNTKFVFFILALILEKQKQLKPVSTK